MIWYDVMWYDIYDIWYGIICDMSRWDNLLDKIPTTTYSYKWTEQEKKVYRNTNYKRLHNANII